MNSKSIIRKEAVANCEVVIAQKDSFLRKDLREAYEKIIGLYPVVNYPKLTFNDYRIILGTRPVKDLPFIEMTLEGELFLRSYEVDALRKGVKVNDMQVDYVGLPDDDLSKLLLKEMDKVVSLMDSELTPKDNPKQNWKAISIDKEKAASMIRNKNASQFFIAGKRLPYIHGHITRTTDALSSIGLGLSKPLYFIRLNDYLKYYKEFRKKDKKYEKLMKRLEKK